MINVTMNKQAKVALVRALTAALSAAGSIPARNKYFYELTSSYPSLGQRYIKNKEEKEFHCQPKNRFFVLSRRSTNKVPHALKNIVVLVWVWTHNLVHQRRDFYRWAITTLMFKT